MFEQELLFRSEDPLCNSARYKEVSRLDRASISKELVGWPKSRSRCQNRTSYPCQLAVKLTAQLAWHSSSKRVPDLSLTVFGVGVQMENSTELGRMTEKRLG